MIISKQITICKSVTDIKIYPESRNEIGLWVAHTPCLTIPVNEVRNIGTLIKDALKYSNSRLYVTNDTVHVLKELRIRNWNTLYKTHKIIGFSLTENRIIITPYIYTPKGVFPDTESKKIFDICNYDKAIEHVIVEELQILHCVGTKHKIMKTAHCRVCGYELPFSPWGDDGRTPTYEICPCCGVEFGNEDYSEESVSEYRKKWIDAKCPWFNPQQKPARWSLNEQLRNAAFSENRTRI